ncbi:hypothetical protein ADIARSV_3196 [Arcticibacter svalbardensis MN12-7]|uniref:Uncharacterized protein n=1 Tax=Arcticibacter svalbardensis MN12-7 TaxID=1150600 RepID=R9GP50_9SPHI|nr:hypothetical protein ADIARSV_3196 [Arcticibacter svalbardensis MN12-7]
MDSVSLFIKAEEDFLQLLQNELATMGAFKIFAGTGHLT